MTIDQFSTPPSERSSAEAPATSHETISERAALSEDLAKSSAMAEERRLAFEKLANEVSNPEGKSKISAEMQSFLLDHVGVGDVMQRLRDCEPRQLAFLADLIREDNLTAVIHFMLADKLRVVGQDAMRRNKGDAGMYEAVARVGALVFDTEDAVRASVDPALSAKVDPLDRSVREGIRGLLNRDMASNGMSSRNAPEIEQKIRAIPAHFPKLQRTLRSLPPEGRALLVTDEALLKATITDYKKWEGWLA